MQMKKIINICLKIYSVLLVINSHAFGLESWFVRNLIPEAAAYLFVIILKFISSCIFGTKISETKSMTGKNFRFRTISHKSRSFLVMKRFQIFGKNTSFIESLSNGGN